MNKKILMFGIPIFALVVVSALAVAYFHSVSVDLTVDEARNSADLPFSLTGYSGETVTKDLVIHNSANVPLSAQLSYVEKTNSYILDNSAGTCLPYPSSTCEKRIAIENEFALADLNSISWDANVLSGYAPHVDVYLDNGEVLVFEYAKVNPADCDDSADYPAGEINTFGDKGIVDDSAYAWLSSGPAGPCEDVTFDAGHKSLANWKVFYPDANVVGMELEIDNWISASSSKIKNIKVNGETTSAIGVIYTNNLPLLIELAPETDTTITAEFTFDDVTPKGIVTGTIHYQKA